jgi:isoamylase
VTDNSFYVIFNAHSDMLKFTLPEKNWGQRWRVILDTVRGWVDDGPLLKAKARLKVAPHSVVLLQRDS